MYLSAGPSELEIAQMQSSSKQTASKPRLRPVTSDASSDMGSVSGVGSEVEIPTATGTTTDLEVGGGNRMRMARLVFVPENTPEMPIFTIWRLKSSGFYAVITRERSAKTMIDTCAKHTGKVQITAFLAPCQGTLQGYEGSTKYLKAL